MMGVINIFCREIGKGEMNMSELPIYNPGQSCVKCGGKDISSSWHKDSYRCNHSSSSIACYGHGDSEHILRHCRNCRYEWVEAPLDNK